MIKHLMNQELPYGEPEYSRLGQQIVEIRKILDKQLDMEGKAMLEQLHEKYLRQGNSIAEDIFKEGFCTALELVLDYLHWKKQ